MYLIDLMFRSFRGFDLTFITSDSEEPISTHTNIGIDIDIDAGAAIITG